LRARSLCPVSPDWLLDLFPDALAEEEECVWNGQARRVEGWRRLKYLQLVVDEKPLAPADMEPRASELLLKEALSAGPSSYCEPEELSAFLNRARFAAQASGDFQAPAEEDVRRVLAELCRGCRSLKELKEAGLVTDLRARLKPRAMALLERLAPERVTLKGGRSLAVHYEADRPPWVESRLQDFFGMAKGPAVADGAVPLVLHLLAPSKRPVQVTTDLAGFWTNHYPQVRRELMRKYPKHKWPENPL
jgi:ATP-dependent helicase HrpB